MLANLKTFKDLVEIGSFSKAAAQNRVTPPAIWVP